MLKSIAAATAAAALFCIAGCGESAEKAGENMDSAIEEATQGEENLGDGAFEKAGEAVDETTDTPPNDDAADAINDATDGDPKTD